MIRRLSSINWKFPLLMSGMILAMAFLFVWASYVQFSAVVYHETGERLRVGARLVAPLVVASLGQRRSEAATIGSTAAVREFLHTGRGRAAAERAVDRTLESSNDPSRLGYELIPARGSQTLQRRMRTVEPWPTWAEERIRADTIDRFRAETSDVRGALDYSPIFSAGGVPVYQVVSTIVARGAETSSDSTLGYYVETRALMGRWQVAVRELVGAGTLIVGVPGAGVWSDFSGVMAGPPPIPRPDTVIVFEESPRGPGLGVAQRVEGTPWLVWFQQPRAMAVRPVNAFIWRLIRIAAAIALLAALIVWLLSRQITDRLVALTDAVDQMEAGQGAGSAQDICSDDEIRQLEGAFDRMAARVSQQQRLEAQLMQSQKIEAVGRLAGGIAHDFNNILTVVRNYTELVRVDMPEGSDSQRDMDEVLKATERAAGLTRQLLAFSRQQAIAPQETDINEVISGSQRMITRLIPSNVLFETHLDVGLAHVHADRGQLEQVFLNLTINAVDAMPDGGTLTIRTLMSPLADRGAPGSSASDERYVCVIVSDTGTGMEPATMHRIFEPFFTTKPVGKGTGLGLPTVHGIVTQAGGHLSVESVPGQGTVFHLYFPACGGSSMGTGPAVPASLYGGAAGRQPKMDSPLATILVVEDDRATREVTRRLLEHAGYRIMEAEHAGLALARLAREADSIDLVLTDVMMPGMSGVDLATRIGERWPAIPVVLMSGYSDSEIRAEGALGRQRSLVEKPFTAAGLVFAVQRALTTE